MDDKIKIKTQQAIIDLLESTKREGMDKIVDWLNTSDFFTAPASTQYHLNCSGGLAFHSLSVYKTLEAKIKKDNNIYGNIPEESLIIVALLHDVCKIDFYDTFMKNVKNEAGQWVQEENYRCNDKDPLGHGEKSALLLLMKGLKLTEEEMYAIRWHMGAFNEDSLATMNYTNAIHKYPLILALHESDCESSNILEDIYLEESSK